MTEIEALDLLDKEKRKGEQIDYLAFGKLLLELTPYLSDRQAGMMWESLSASAPIEVMMELGGGSDNVVPIRR
ncbi:hypothetical protein K6Q96_09070 [Grimontia kaedaensis]|uniref:Uncharacterized protein n=1 Tax=Grimontia kaedaensis TaxID=2872157 RepID=A0ABY4WPI9_9GAMM|nr:hypothetical protein [Grimontia kaedaensis]USH01092.1 hypothetical protein K6Q96_09070 [Grimontia kaedaensis]